MRHAASMRYFDCKGTESWLPCSLNSIFSDWFHWHEISVESLRTWGMITLPLVQVMAQCHQALSHNLNQSWLMIRVPYGFNRSHWVKVFKDLDKMNMCVFFCTNKQIGLMVSNAACCLTYITGATILGLYSLRRRRLISIGIPIINLRRSSDRLRFIMGIPIPVRRRLLSE